MEYRDLVALPVFNEAHHVEEVLDEVARYASDILVVDDGSTDATAALLAQRDDIAVVAHPENLGYGAALQSAFCYAAEKGYDFLVTIDCDGQHEPQLIPDMLAACRDVDIASGSRYLCDVPDDAAPPARRAINQAITRELNELLELNITDAFCGFKAYRVSQLEKLQSSEPGYAMPLQLWVQAARHGLRIREVSVPLIYLEEKRSFGGALDNAEKRLAYYRRILDEAMDDACMLPTSDAISICEPTCHAC